MMVTLIREIILFMCSAVRPLLFFTFRAIGQLQLQRDKVGTPGAERFVRTKRNKFDSFPAAITLVAKNRRVKSIVLFESQVIFFNQNSSLTLDTEPARQDELEKLTSTFNCLPHVWDYTKQCKNQNTTSRW